MADLGLYLKVNFILVKYYYKNPLKKLQSTPREMLCIIFDWKYEFSEEKYALIKVEIQAISPRGTNILSGADCNVFFLHKLKLNKFLFLYIQTLVFFFATTN